MRGPSLLVALGLLGGCGSHETPAPLVRPVQSTVVHYGAAGEPVSLSGQIQAQIQANLAFRISGRLIERRVTGHPPLSSGE